MVIHVDGTTPPQAPAMPEYLKAHVYMPPNLIDEFPDSHDAIASIVQSFIETVGVPTVMRWRRAAMNNNWSLTQSGNLPAPSTNNLPTVPNPVTPSLSYYIFPGRPHGSLQTTSQPPPSGSHTSSLHTQPGGLQGSQAPSFLAGAPDGDGHGNWYTVMEENTRLLRELNQAHVKEEEHEVTIARLQEEIRTIMMRPERRLGDEVSARAGRYAMPSSGLGSRSTRQQTSGNVRPAPSMAYSRSFPVSSLPVAYHRSPSTSPVRESSTRQSLYPSLSSPPPTASLSRSQLHQVHFSGTSRAAPSSYASAGYGGGLRSFGAATARFIDRHGLSDRLHRQLYELYEGTLATKWLQEIAKWFQDCDEIVVQDLAGGLYAAMCEDADIHNQY